MAIVCHGQVIAVIQAKRQKEPLLFSNGSFELRNILVKGGERDGGSKTNKRGYSMLWKKGR